MSVSKAEVFAAFAEEILELACISNKEGHFIWLSKGWSEHLGWSREELLATPFIEFVHPDDLASTRREVVALESGSPTARFCNRYRTTDGRWRWLEWTSTQDSDVYYSAVRDITAEREHALDGQRRMRLLELSLAVAKAGYWRWDMENDQLEWSKEVYQIHGLDPESFVPTVAGGVDAFHPDDRAAVQAAISGAVEEKRPFSFELRLVRSDGAIRNVISSGRPEVDEAGAVVGLFGVFRDVTEDPERLRREELEQFAYFASHDLREPARTISAYIDLIRESVELTGKQKKYFRFVSEASKRMLSMVTGLRRFARAGREMVLVPVPLSAVVDDVLQDLGAVIAERNPTVKVAELPVVLGAPEPLRQVFQNLLSNALKFGPEEGAVVSISSTRLGPEHVVTVEDNGPGIEQKYEARVFEPFQRLDTSKPGTGIGLSIVKRIVQQCGGRVWVDRSFLGGAAFHVALRALP